MLLQRSPAYLQPRQADTLRKQRDAHSCRRGARKARRGRNTPGRMGGVNLDI